MPDVVSTAVFLAEMGKVHNRLDSIDERQYEVNSKLVDRMTAHEKDDAKLAERILSIEVARTAEEKVETASHSAAGRRIAIISTLTSAAITVVLWLLNTFWVAKVVPHS